MNPRLRAGSDVARPLQSFGCMRTTPGKRRKLFGGIGLLLVVAVAAGCGDSSNDPVASEERVVCLWESAECLKMLCPGCTAGSYTSCPPPSSVYKPGCDLKTETNCRAVAHGAYLVNNIDLYLYARNVRIVRGALTCSDVLNGATGTSEEILCSGDC